MLSTASDTELWNATGTGNQSALGELFRRHYALLYQYGNKICRDKPALEDCIQELFTDIWQKKTPTPLNSVKAYLLQALKFKLYKNFRVEKKHHSEETDTYEEFEISHENFLIDEQDGDQKLQQIIAVMNQLPPRQREIIYLKIYKGLSYGEISQMMDINYQAVRNLLYTALKNFRNSVTLAATSSSLIVLALGLVNRF